MQDKREHDISKNRNEDDVILEEKHLINASLEESLLECTFPVRQELESLEL